MPKADITLLTLDYPPHFGGVARFLGNLVRESGGTMRVIVPADHALDGPGNVVVKPLFWALWPRWWPMVKLARRLKNETRVLFVSHVFPVGTAAWLSRLTGGPEYAILFHGLDIKLANSVWKRWLLRRICRKAKAIFTNSRATQDELRKLAPWVQTTVMTPGIEAQAVPTREEARHELGLNPQTDIVLTVTRLVPRKGVDLALHAMARIQQHRDVEYVVLGDGPDKARLQRMADECRTRTRWIKDADDAEKWLWYAASDIFLLPVREDKDDMEGFGIAYLEAALAGIPSIAGKSGGAGEAVRHEYSGLLVNPKSIDEIEAAVERLLTNPELRLRLGRQGRQRALRDFRWEDRWRLFSEGLSLGKEGGETFKDMSEADIAVVIPCHNHAAELEEALKSLERQTLHPIEVAVVDDASQDDVQAVVEKFKSRLPITYERFEENRGAPAARNRGANMTDAPYLLFMDADVVLEPQALAKFSQALQTAPAVGFAYSNFFWGWKKFTGRPWDVEALKKLNFIHTTSLVKRSVFPGFDEALKKFQDWDLWLTIAEHGFKGVWIDACLFKVKPRAVGMSSWLPSGMHKLPWPILGWMPKEIRKYREAEKIIRKKHGIGYESSPSVLAPRG